MLTEPMRATAACLILMLAVPFVRADDEQLLQLMQSLAQNKSGSATFVETKYMAIIDRPLVSTGNLSFVAPDKLEKHTLTPKPESLVLDGDVLTIDRPGKRPMKIGLANHPEVTAFIESIRGTLAGDLTTLRTFYTLQLSGSADNWQLALTPKQERLNQVFSLIRISGTHADVKTIELNECNGDRTVMVITQASVNR